MKDLYKKYFMNQKMMRTVLISLAPIVVSSIYFFGWRVMLLYLSVIVGGVITEGIFAKRERAKFLKQFLYHPCYIL